MRSLLVLLFLPMVASGADIPADFLTTQPGTLPIIISAPHGGRKAIPDCPERKGENVDKFVVVNDTNTELLAKKLAEVVEKKMNGKPYLVIAQFQRKYVDANRPAKDAYEHEKAKPFYEAYHKFLNESRDAVQKDWGRGLVIDLHGQAADAATIFRGTNNLKSVKHLLDRFGKAGVTGEKSVLGQLAKNGYKIFPANDAKDDENPRFSGGYITQTYGSKDRGSVDAIQLELGFQMRTKDNLDKFANDLAEAISVFAKEYLPSEKK